MSSESPIADVRELMQHRGAVNAVDAQLGQPRRKLAREEPLESILPQGTSDVPLRFDRERRRRRKAEKRVRRTAVEFLAARRIQQKLFPAAPPVLPGVDIAGIARPAEATGGDYFDYVPMLNESVGIVVGDVSGHGFGPALLMASTRAYMRAFAQTHSDLGELLSLVNRVLGFDMEDNRFVTLVLARFDPRTRSLAYVSAGHPSGYVLDKSGQVRVCLPSTGLPLGIGSESYSASAVIPLQPGELVILLSDGVTEATAPDGSAFGWGRAVGIVRVYRDDPPARIVANLYHAVRAFSQNAAQLDDITAVVIKIEQPDIEQSRADRGAS
jgi:phosphoserine phosphatase RsbU/P